MNKFWDKLKKKNSIYFLFCVLLMSCSNGQLKTATTYLHELDFQIDNRFEKYEKYPDLNRFDYGKYNIEIEIFSKSNEFIRNTFNGYQSGSETSWSIGHAMDFTKTDDVFVQNEKGYPIVVLYGGGKDKSTLFPTYYSGFVCFVETPNYIVKILLKHTAHRPNAMDKTEAITYLKPILKSLKEN